MSALEKTLVKIARFLKRKKIPYMVIGGVANLFWGIPRTTLDVDVTVDVREKNYPSICAPEDLIIHKIISERARDREDVQGIIRQLGKSLDRMFLDRVVRELAEALAKPDLYDFYLKSFS